MYNSKPVARKTTVSSLKKKTRLTAHPKLKTMVTLSYIFHPKCKPNNEGTNISTFSQFGAPKDEDNIPMGS